MCKNYIRRKSRTDWRFQPVKAEANVIGSQYDRAVLVTAGYDQPAAAWRTTRDLYDAFGDPTGSVDPGGVETQESFDADGEETGETDAAESTDAETTAAYYDAQGNETLAVDAGGDLARTAYDDPGRAVEVTDARSFPTAQFYDTDGNLTGCPSEVLHSIPLMDQRGRGGVAEPGSLGLGVRPRAAARVAIGTRFASARHRWLLATSPRRLALPDLRRIGRAGGRRGSRGGTAPSQ